MGPVEDFLENTIGLRFESLRPYTVSGGRSNFPTEFESRLPPRPGLSPSAEVKVTDRKSPERAITTCPNDIHIRIYIYIYMHMCIF